MRELRERQINAVALPRRRVRASSSTGCPRTPGSSSPPTTASSSARTATSATARSCTRRCSRSRSSRASSPEPAATGLSMDPELERRTLAAEDGHWWYLGRRAIVLDAARRSLAAAPRPRILDAGCGGGAVLAELARPRDRGRARALGGEPRARARPRRRRGRRRRPRAPAVRRRRVRPRARRSTCSSTSTTTAARSPSCAASCAPAARWWSRCPPTRASGAATTSSTTTAAATRAPRCAPRPAAGGWEVARLTHFNSLLLPAAAIARRFDRGDGLEIPPAPLNRALELPLRLERRAIAAGVSLPLRPLAARRAALSRAGYSVSPAASSASAGSR